MVFHADDIRLLIPVHLPHIVPRLIPRRLDQRSPQLGGKAGLAPPHQLVLLLLPRNLGPFDALDDLIVRTDAVLEILPRPETEIGHQPGGLLARSAGQHPDGIVGLGDVVDAVLDRKHELDVGLIGAVRGGDQRPVHGAQHAQDLSPMVLPLGAGGDDVEFAVVDEGPGHALLQRNRIQIVHGDAVAGLPEGGRPRDVLEQARKRGLAPVSVEAFIAIVAAVLKRPFGGGGRFEGGELGAVETAGALEGGRALAGAVSSGDELGQEGVELVAVRIEAQPAGIEEETGGRGGQAQQQPQKAPSERPETGHGEDDDVTSAESHLGKAFIVSSDRFIFRSWFPSFRLFVLRDEECWKLDCWSEEKSICRT